MTDEELATWRRFVELKIKAHDDKFGDIEERVIAYEKADAIIDAIAKNRAAQRARDIALGAVSVGVVGLIIRAIGGG